MLAAFPAASWLFTDDPCEGAEDFPGGTILRDDAGNILRVSLGPNDVDCRPCYTADRDDWIVKALVASEDSTFWSHCGVRPLSALRAACQNIFSGRRVSGASTITMQTVRLIAPHPKSLWWKWKESILALKLERQKPKEWIISQYLNRAPFGSNFIGIESAAQGWFGKSAKELGLAEAALLAGMVQAPSRLRPDRHYDRAAERREYVLDRMLALGLITEEQRDEASSIRPSIRRAPRPFAAPFFCDWAISHFDPGHRGGDFTTALDANIQNCCDDIVNAASKENDYSVAAVVMRVCDGQVVALACSGDYFNDESGQVNTAVSPRPAGSTLKPFLVALAFDRGLVAPDERLCDIPSAFKGYRPANFDAKHRGLVSLRESLILSLNIPFVQMLKRTGVAEFGDCLRSLGFGHITGGDEHFGLGMAIGNVEVTLLELVNAYAALARGGDRILSPASCFIVSDMLSGSERAQAAFGHLADVKSPRFAWKTGTSSAYRDAWTAAWNPEWVVGVWCGHKSGGFGDRSLVGAKAAAPLAWKIARSLYPQNDGPWFVRPHDVVPRRVCTCSGKPASPDCPDVCDGWSIAGVTPSTLCTTHRRDADGNPVTLEDPALAAFRGTISRAEKLSIATPEDGAEFTLIDGQLDQQIVCRATGNPDGSRLWWFIDGKLAGESEGSSPKPLPMTEGKHVISCSTADGISASITVSVLLHDE